MKKCISSIVLMIVFVVSMMPSAAAVQSVAYAHNLQVTDVWLNPGDYLAKFDMEDKSDKFIVDLSNSIVGDVTEERERFEAIYQWTIDNIYYDYVAYQMPMNTTVITAEDNQKLVDEGFYYVNEDGDKHGLANGPVTTAILRRGVCWDYAVLLHYLLSAQNIPCIIIRGYANSYLPDNIIPMVEDTNHAWNAVFVDGRWAFVDATWDSGNTYEDGIYLAGFSSLRYFDIPLDVLSLDHLFMEYGTSEENDIPSDWAQDIVAEAISIGIVPYTLQGRYREAISRQEFCQLVMQTLKNISPELVGNISDCPSPFTDVDDGAVTLAKQLNIVEGVGDGRFDPFRSISRQEAAVMLGRLVTVLDLYIDKPAKDFSDSEFIAVWAVDGVQKVTALGIMEGTGGAFDPFGTYTVEQAIITVERIQQIS